MTKPTILVATWGDGLFGDHWRSAHARDCEPARQRARTGWTRRCVCVAKLIDGRISIPEQLLRGGRRTDRTASDDANGTEKEATGTSKARLRDRDIPHR